FATALLGDTKRLIANYNLTCTWLLEHNCCICQQRRKKIHVSHVMVLNLIPLATEELHTTYKTTIAG
ncbi:hypothetical protein ACJX0J_014879, partial [Zea mays]